MMQNCSDSTSQSKWITQSHPIVSQSKEIGYSSKAKTVTRSLSSIAWFLVTEAKTEGSETHKQTATERRCSKCPTHLKGVNYIC